MASKEMESLKQIMQQMMAAGFAPKFDGSADAMQLRKVVQQAQDNMAAITGVSFIDDEFAGIESEISMPDDAKDDYIVVYIHGGGLICGNAKSSRGYASMLADECKRPVISFTYRLAPENKFPAMTNDSYDVYKAVTERYPDKPVYLIGESGGAYLCLAVAMMARDTGIKMPVGIVPYSPPIIFNDDIDRNFDGNKDFTVKPDSFVWLGELAAESTEATRTEKYLNLTLDDYHDFCPVFLAWDESETLSVDSIWLTKAFEKAGVEYEAYSYPDCFHAFATTGRGTPESYEIMKNTVKFFDKHK